MATILDALLITLELDATKFVQGQKNASAALKRTRDDAQQTAVELQARGAQASDFYGALNKGASSLLNLIAAGDIGRFTMSAVDGMTAMNRAATAMGMKTSDVQAYGNYIARMGGNAKDATASLQGLSQMMANYKLDPRSMSADQLFALGKIGADNPNMQPLDVIRRFATWAQAHQKDPQGVSAVAQKLGIDEGSAYALRTQGAAGLTKGMAESYALGTMDDKQLAEMAKTKGAIASFTQALTGAGNALVSDLGPAVPVLNSLTKLMTTFPGATQGILAMSAMLVFLNSAKALIGLTRLIGAAGAAGNAAKAGGAVVGAAEGAAGGAVATTVVKTAGKVLLRKFIEPIALWDMASDNWKRTVDLVKTNPFSAKGQKAMAAADHAAPDPLHIKDGLNALFGIHPRAGSVAAGVHAAVTGVHRAVAVAHAAVASGGGGGAPPWYNPNPASRSERGNNPGNIMQGPNYRTFATMNDGWAAMERQIKLDIYKHGQTTLRSLISGPHGWSPDGAPNNPAGQAANYIRAVSRMTGLSADAKLPTDEGRLRILMLAMHQVEAGPPRAGHHGAGLGGPVTNSVHIDRIIVHAENAKDGDRVAKSIKHGIERNSLVHEMNTGLS